MVTSDDNQVLSNTITAPTSLFGGIFLAGNRNVIKGNTIDQTGQFGISIIAGEIRGNALITEGAIIKDNSITNNNVGIAIGFGSPLNTVVIGNTIVANTNVTIRNNGTGTVEAGNIS